MVDGFDKPVFVATSSMVNELLAQATIPPEKAEIFYRNLDEDIPDFPIVIQKLYQHFSDDMKSEMILYRLEGIRKWGTQEDLKDLQKNFDIPKAVLPEFQKVRFYKQQSEELAYQFDWLDKRVAAAKDGRLTDISYKNAAKVVFSIARDYIKAVEQDGELVRSGAFWDLSEAFSTFAPYRKDVRNILCHVLQVGENSCQSASAGQKELHYG